MITDFSDDLKVRFNNRVRYGTSSSIYYVADDIRDSTEVYIKKRSLSYALVISGMYQTINPWTGSFVFTNWDYQTILTAAHATLRVELAAIPTQASLAPTKQFTDAIDHFFTTFIEGLKVKAQFVGTAYAPPYSTPISPANFPNTLTSIVQSTVSGDAAAIIPKLNDMVPKEKHREKTDPYYPCPIEMEEETLQRIGATDLVDYLCKLIGKVLDNGLRSAVITVSSAGANIAVASPCVVS